MGNRPSVFEFHGTCAGALGSKALKQSDGRSRLPNLDRRGHTGGKIFCLALKSLANVLGDHQPQMRV